MHTAIISEMSDYMVVNAELTFKAKNGPISTGGYAFEFFKNSSDFQLQTFRGKNVVRAHVHTVVFKP